MTVYLVWHGEYEYRDCVAVFKRYDEASRYIARQIARESAAYNKKIRTKFWKNPPGFTHDWGEEPEPMRVRVARRKRKEGKG